FVTVVEADGSAKAGMNSPAIDLTTNALVAGGDLGKPGIPCHVILRAILDCETLSGVVSTLQRGMRSSSANYLVGYRDGIAMDIEAAPGDFSELHMRFPERDVLVHTNHFLSASAQEGD